MPDELSERGEPNAIGKGPTGPAQTARYIGDLVEELEALARKSGLDVIAYLLGMALAEARQQERKDIDGAAPASRA